MHRTPPEGIPSPRVAILIRIRNSLVMDNRDTFTWLLGGKLETARAYGLILDRAELLKARPAAIAYLDQLIEAERQAEAGKAA